MNASRPSMVSLPIELVVAILEYLDTPTLLLCNQLCRLLHSTINSAVTLRYKLDLYAAHLADGPPSAEGKADRRRLLETHQEAWNNGEWSRSGSIHLSKEETSMESAWELINGVLAFGVGRRLRCIQLPSALRDIPEKEWFIEDIGFTLRDFTMDPAQDLLVILETALVGATELFRIHIRTLSNGERYPAAQRAVISHVQNDNNWWYAIQVYGRYVAVMLLSEEVNELVVWNWMTGEKQKAFTGFKGKIETYTFLNECLLMIGVVHGDEPRARLTLDVFDFNAISDLTSDLEDHGSADISTMPKVCSFHYPPLISVVHPDDTTFAIRTNGISSHGSQGPFTTSVDDRLMVITISHYGTIAHCVLLSTILAKVDGIPKDSPNFVFAWEDWGPQDTRILELDFPDIWHCFVHGMKAVVASIDGEFSIIDFNQRSIRCRSTLEPAEDFQTMYLVGPRKSDEDRELFHTPVETSLPCRIHTVEAPSYDGEVEEVDFMMTEDSIIMIPQGTRGINILICCASEGICAVWGGGQSTWVVSGVLADGWVEKLYSGIC